MANPKASDRAPMSESIDNALNLIANYAHVDGVHHKQWVLDQVTRALFGAQESDGDMGYMATDEYRAWINEVCANPNDGGPDGKWDEGIAP